MSGAVHHTPTCAAVTQQTVVKGVASDQDFLDHVVDQF
jgi:hypothetical protein